MIIIVLTLSLLVTIPAAYHFIKGRNNILILNQEVIARHQTADQAAENYISVLRSFPKLREDAASTDAAANIEMMTHAGRLESDRLLIGTDRFPRYRTPEEAVSVYKEYQAKLETAVDEMIRAISTFNNAVETFPGTLYAESLGMSKMNANFYRMEINRKIKKAQELYAGGTKTKVDESSSNFYPSGSDIMLLFKMLNREEI